MIRKPWSDFAEVRSVRAPHGSRAVAADELVVMADYRKEERVERCEDHDPVSTCLAYAQDALVYDTEGRICNTTPENYALSLRTQRVNVFGLAYRFDAPFLLHRILADIVIEAAILLYHQHGWHTVLFDGLRTVEAAYRLYQLATNEDLNAGLLALPGQSAHNKGLAVDSMMFTMDGREVPMGGHFDHPDMSTNMRDYRGDKVGGQAQQHRLIREGAFLRAALSQGLLIAPLKSEFWDDRLPEDRSDLWRVLDSAARVVGAPFYIDRESFALWNYEDFSLHWRTVFKGHEQALQKKLGVLEPPSAESFEFYHGNFHPIYDRDLRRYAKHLTEL